MATRFRKPSARWKKFLQAQSLVDLGFIQRFSKNGEVRYFTKKRLRELQRRGRRLAQFNQKLRQRRKREARTARVLLGGKGNHERARIAREIWKRRPRPPIGSLLADRALFAAMWPAAWRSARQIGERIDWTQFRPARSGRSPSRLVKPLHRLIAHGVVEKTVRGRNYTKGVHGRVSAHFFRLMPAGVDLRWEIEIGIVPKWRSLVRVSSRPVEERLGNRLTLCAMTPAVWQSVGDICLVLGWPRLNGPKRRTVDNALAQLVPAGMVGRARNVDWQGPGPRAPKYLYQLTAPGERSREGLMLIG